MVGAGGEGAKKCPNSTINLRPTHLKAGRLLLKYKWPVAKGDSKGICGTTPPLANHTTRQ